MVEAASPCRILDVTLLRTAIIRERRDGSTSFMLRKPSISADSSSSKTAGSDEATLTSSNNCLNAQPATTHARFSEKVILAIDQSMKMK
jgi:hypothetical protein